MGTGNRGAVVVTGSSSGIGRATALRLAREGFRAFAGVRKAADGEALSAEGGPNLVPLRIDVADAESVRAAADEVARTLGNEGLAGLVNNAGIGVSAPLEFLPMDALRHQFEVNVFGQVAVIQAFLPLLRRRPGRIINIGSIGDRLTVPFGGALCSSKSAFASLNDALRLELSPWGIHVSLVEPASIATPAVDKVLGDADAFLAQAPREANERYGTLFRTFTARAMAREKAGSPPEVVAAAVLEALTARRPRERYLVGKDSTRLALVAALLPHRTLDFVRHRLFGMPSRFGSWTALAPEGASRGEAASSR